MQLNLLDDSQYCLRVDLKALWFSRPHSCVAFLSVAAMNFSLSIPVRRCLKYMGDYTSCLMQGYGVLPSSPQRVKVSNVDTSFAIVSWNPPKKLSETVKHYNVYYGKVDEDYEVATKVTNLVRV